MGPGGTQGQLNPAAAPLRRNASGGLFLAALERKGDNMVSEAQPPVLTTYSKPRPIIHQARLH